MHKCKHYICKRRYQRISSATQNTRTRSWASYSDSKVSVSAVFSETTSTLSKSAPLVGPLSVLEAFLHLKLSMQSAARLLATNVTAWKQVNSLTKFYNLKRRQSSDSQHHLRWSEHQPATYRIYLNFKNIKKLNVSWLTRDKTLSLHPSHHVA